MAKNGGIWRAGARLRRAGRREHVVGHDGCALGTLPSEEADDPAEQRRHAISSHIICHAFTVCAACGYLLLPGAARQLPDKALGLFAANREVGWASVHAPPAVTVGSPVTPVCTRTGMATA
jgi:hypothetical protein